MIILQWFKSLYFLRLIDEIAPLVNIIFVIVHDIKYFLIIFFISIIAFSSAFHVIGKNQEYLANEEYIRNKTEQFNQ